MPSLLEYCREHTHGHKSSGQNINTTTILATTFIVHGSTTILATTFTVHGSTTILATAFMGYNIAHGSTNVLATACIAHGITIYIHYSMQDCKFPLVCWPNIYIYYIYRTVNLHLSTGHSSTTYRT